MANALQLSDDTKAMLNSHAGRELRAAFDKLYEMALENVLIAAANKPIDDVRYNSGVMNGIRMAQEVLNPR